MKDASRRGTGRAHAAVHTLFFPPTLFSPVPPSFVHGFAVTYPKQTTRKRGKRSARRRGRGTAEGAGSPDTAEKEGEKGEAMGEEGRERRGGTKREDGRERIRAHTRPRSCNARMTRRRAARERDGGARGERGEDRGRVRGTEFILRAFFLSFVDSALLCGERAACCSTIRLRSQGRPR